MDLNRGNSWNFQIPIRVLLLISIPIENPTNPYFFTIPIDSVASAGINLIKGTRKNHGGFNLELSSLG